MYGKWRGKKLFAGRRIYSSALDLIWFHPYRRIVSKCLATILSGLWSSQLQRASVSLSSVRLKRVRIIWCVHVCHHFESNPTDENVFLRRSSDTDDGARHPLDHHIRHGLVRHIGMLLAFTIICLPFCRLGVTFDDFTFATGSQPSAAYLLWISEIRKQWAMAFVPFSLVVDGDVFKWCVHNMSPYFISLQLSHFNIFICISHSNFFRMLNISTADSERQIREHHVCSAVLGRRYFGETDGKSPKWTFGVIRSLRKAHHLM